MCHWQDICAQVAFNWHSFIGLSHFQSPTEEETTFLIKKQLLSWLKDQTKKPVKLEITHSEKQRMKVYHECFSKQPHHVWVVGSFCFVWLVPETIDFVYIAALYTYSKAAAAVV